jgi:hypothetical protein
MLTCALALLFGTATAEANGGEGPYEGPEATDTESAVTFSVSPLRLTEPMLELTGEFRTGPNRSFAIIGGMGSGPNSGRWELGGQVRDYVIGSFDNGISFGGQMKYGNYDVSEMGVWGTPGTMGQWSRMGSSAPTSPTTGQSRRPGVTGRAGATGGGGVAGRTRMGANEQPGAPGSTPTRFESMLGSSDRHASFGPFVGVKLTVSLFTLEAQGGAQIRYSRERMALEPMMNVTTGLTF